MTNDKELATELVNALEKLYLHNAVVTSVLMMFQKYAPKLGPWQTLVAELEADPKFSEPVKKLFVPLRQRIQEGTNLASAIEQFLKVVPPSSVEN